MRLLVSVLVSALLVAPAAAQMGSKTSQSLSSAQGAGAPKIGAPGPKPSQPLGGVQSANPPKPAAGPDAAWVAKMRARHELAKANGQLAPERLARQAARLAALEAQLAGSHSYEKPSTGGVFAADQD